MARGVRRRDDLARWSSVRSCGRGKGRQVHDSPGRRQALPVSIEVWALLVHDGGFGISSTAAASIATKRTQPETAETVPPANRTLGGGHPPPRVDVADPRQPPADRAPAARLPRPSGTDPRIAVPSDCRADRRGRRGDHGSGPPAVSDGLAAPSEVSGGCGRRKSHPSRSWDQPVLVNETNDGVMAS